MNIYIYENEMNLLPPADLGAEIMILQEELLNERERNLRTIADFMNYRRRIERSGNKIAMEDKKELLLSLLDISGDMEKLQHAQNKEDRNSVKEIHKKLLTVLEKNGVVSFESIGKPFNYNLHEAIAAVNEEGIVTGIVVGEVSRSYM
jgi:molecular chaperone GrpE